MRVQLGQRARRGAQGHPQMSRNRDEARVVNTTHPGTEGDAFAGIFVV